MAMESEYRNIYQNARRTAGLTQERWAEVLGIGPDAVRKYESGIITPSDEVCLRMCEVAGQWILAYWHLNQKSRLAGTVLPELTKRSLSEAVLNLLVRVEEFSRGGLEDLKRLASDGKIDSTEVMAFGDALQELRELIAAAYELQYAEGADCVTAAVKK